MAKFTLGFILALAPLTVFGEKQQHPTEQSTKVFRAGASAVDVTPVEFPVKVNGGFFEATATEVHDRLYARCLVLDDGSVRIAIVVVDNCLIPQDIFDRAKEIAHKTSGIPPERIMMSATHTHSGPAAVGALGTEPDEKYCKFLPGQIAKAIELATQNLKPAKVGWSVEQDAEHTYCRRWILRPDRIQTDPFGRASVRAMMHPGHQNPDYLGPAGSVDTDLSLLAVQSLDGRPIAVLANYSMHYFGAQAISADYFGLFSKMFAELIRADQNFVAMMSQGTSGDLQWRDYGKPATSLTIKQYTELVARVAYEAYNKIKYHDYVQLTMAEKKLGLNIRPISEQDLSWAKQTFEKFKDRKPQSLPEVYAREQVLLEEAPPARELKLQALRIGELGIVAIPCEVFGITGLKIKAQSPLQPTFNIELANGYYGYLPPPSQHNLGGYTTWRARSAGLEVEAEPKITACVLDLLEEVSGKSRRTISGDDYPLGDYPKAVLASNPVAYWRCNEFSGPVATDASGNGNDGRYEGGVTFYLEGPIPSNATTDSRVNRSPQLAGGWLKATLKNLAQNYTVEFWFCNFLPTDARNVTGVLFSRPSANILGDYIYIGGTEVAGGKLIFGSGISNNALFGRTSINLKTWHHLALVRDGNKVNIYLDGNSIPEISREASGDFSSGADDILIGRRADDSPTFEGRIDEVAIYSRALTAEEIAAHYKAVNSSKQ
jgi:hypothetical protein